MTRSMVQVHISPPFCFEEEKTAFWGGFFFLDRLWLAAAEFLIKWSWLDVMSWCCYGGLRLAAVAAAEFLRCFNEKFDKKKALNG